MKRDPRLTLITKERRHASLTMPAPAEHPDAAGRAWLQRLAMPYQRMSLLQRFALISLIVFVALGVAVSYRFSQSIQETAIQGAVQTAQDSLQARLLDQVPR